jgi:hypothetical protein
MRLEIAKGKEAAEKLREIGQPVIVRNDDGSELASTLTSLPWELGHGQWVVKVQGKSGGFDCARVRPA